jgi:hypothetical protein
MNTDRRAAPAALRNFEDLPDTARVSAAVPRGLWDISETTLRRRVAAGIIPAPVKDGRDRRWIVGELRAALVHHG